MPAHFAFRKSLSSLPLKPKLRLAVALALALTAAHAAPLFPASPHAPRANSQARGFTYGMAKSAAIPGDTLEVFCIYVQFKKEAAKVGDKGDEAATTGLGTFGSDTALSYKLDPNGEAVRSSRFYLEKHFEFARNYFETVSGGGVTVIPRIFPRPNVDGRIEKPVQLSEHIKFYNPDISDKKKKQKISDFEKLRGQRLMQFVRESVLGADALDSADNPFRVAKAEGEKNPNPHHKRVFLLFHAGHSRLVDGGGLGILGANTPNDFTDFFVTKPDFTYLDSLSTDAPSKKEMRADTLGVKLSTGDTLSEVMLLSEAASQDKVNWGINGILVNQIGRALGMPDMFDVVRGFSQLGGFCMMDFAGYNSLDGFVPIYPSAWVRSYMGWEYPQIAAPGGSGTATTSEYRIYAPDLGGNGRATTLKVPLNEREYLLVENRQRSLDDTVTLYFSRRANANDIAFGKPDSVRVPFTFLDSVFSDSVCAAYQKNSTTCKTKKINTLRPEGVVTGASSFDLGLPGSGLLVWRVNQWFIDWTVKYGYVNAYLGDTLRSQYKGVELVEADGFLTIGKEFKDPLGQSAFDYGSGSDMLPHLYRKQKNPPKDTTWGAAESLTVISPYGQANTNAWNDARTHIRLEALAPPKPKFDVGLATFAGDSIFTFRDSALTLRVRWADNASISRAGLSWPRSAATGVSATALAPLMAGGKPYVLALSDSGFVQAYAGDGKPALAVRKIITPPRGYDSAKTLLPDGNIRDTVPVPVNSLVDSLGPSLGSAVAIAGDSQRVAVLTAKALQLLAPLADSLALSAALPATDTAAPARTGARLITVALNSRLGPVAVGDKFWVFTAEGELRGFSADGSEIGKVAVPGDAKLWQSLGAYAGDGKQAQPDHLALIGQGGKLALIDIAQLRAQSVDLQWGSPSPAAEEVFTLAFADFNRDGQCDAVALGSRGHVQVTSLATSADLRLGEALPGWPQVFPRSVRWVDSVYRYTSEDFSGPAIADLDGDRYPDLVFTALNSVYALDRRGARLPGWPTQVQPRQNVGLLYGSSKAPEAVVGSTPVVLSLGGSPTVLVASPDGLILAIDALGKRLTRSSFDNKDRARMGPAMVDVGDWPLSVGGLSTDTSAYPFIRMMAAPLIDHGKDMALELVTYTGTGGLDAVTLKGAVAKAGQSWLMPGGSASRSGYLSLGDWEKAVDAVSGESIQAFWLYPSPLRGPAATVHLEIGAAAERARIKVFDISGNVVKSHEWTRLAPGRQPDNQKLDLSRLGPDVYSVLCEVWFPGGKKQKWERLGVVR